MTLNSSRRIFLKSSALAGVVFGAAPRSLMRSVFAAEGNPGRRKTFVVVFQRTGEGGDVVFQDDVKDHWGLSMQ